MSLGTIAIAIFVWLVCFVAWLIWGKKRLGSPILIYLVFHLFVFVIRPWWIYQGADQTFLRDWIGVWLTPDDHSRAVWASSLGLIAFTIGGLIGETIAMRRTGPRLARRLDSEVVMKFGGILLLLSFVTYVRFVGLNPQDALQFGAAQDRYVIVDTSQGFTAVSSTTAYVSGFYNVAIGVVLVMLCAFGFRRWLLGIALMVLVMYVLQGFARTLYVTGVFSLALVALRLRGQSWPSPRMVAVGVIAFLSFAAGKSWPQKFLSEGPLAAAQDARANLQHYFSPDGESVLTYDMIAATVHVIPRYAEHSGLLLYGRIIYGWVPRAIWPGKPIFDYAGGYIQSNIHQISFEGLVVGMVGETYMAYGLASVVLFMFLYGALLAGAVSWAFRFPTNSVEFVVGVALCALVPQLARDGIQPIVQYMLYFAGPAVIMWGICLLTGRATRVPVDPDGRYVEPAEADAMSPERLLPVPPVTGGVLDGMPLPERRGIAARRAAS